MPHACASCICSCYSSQPSASLAQGFASGAVGMGRSTMFLVLASLLVILFCCIFQFAELMRQVASYIKNEASCLIEAAGVIMRQGVS
mgnify:CR=1 FL=1